MLCAFKWKCSCASGRGLVATMNPARAEALCDRRRQTRKQDGLKRGALSISYGKKVVSTNCVWGGLCEVAPWNAAWTAQTCPDCRSGVYIYIYYTFSMYIHIHMQYTCARHCRARHLGGFALRKLHGLSHIWGLASGLGFLSVLASLRTWQLSCSH